MAINDQEQRYVIFVTYRGFDMALDRKLDSSAHIPNTGAGYGFYNDARDRSYGTNSRQTVANVVKRLRQTLRNAHRRGKVTAYDGTTDKVIRL